MDELIVEIKAALKGMYIYISSLPINSRKRNSKSVQDKIGNIQASFREMVLMRHFLNKKGLVEEYDAFSEEIIEKIKK